MVGSVVLVDMAVRSWNFISRSMMDEIYPKAKIAKTTTLTIVMVPSERFYAKSGKILSTLLPHCGNLGSWSLPHMLNAPRVRTSGRLAGAMIRVA